MIRSTTSAFWLVQIPLIVAWYALPAMAAVPWWAIFLPVILSVCLGVFVAIVAFAAALRLERAR
jgi:hypothetical protein